MLSDKVLFIRQAWFNLPKDFNGNLSDALLLMANHAKEQEELITLNEVEDKTNNGLFNVFVDSVNKNETKCTISYNLFHWSEEHQQWEDM